MALEKQDRKEKLLKFYVLAALFFWTLFVSAAAFWITQNPRYLPYGILWAFGASLIGLSYQHIKNVLRQNLAMQQKIADLARFPSENPNPVLRLSAEGRVLYSNPAGARLLDAWKCKVDQFVRREQVALVRQAVQTNQPVYVEQTIADDITYTILFAPIRESNYVNVYAANITERVNSQKELINAKIKAENANYIKNNFLANMSHEIRTPMNNIVGFSDLLADEVLNQKHEDYVKTIRESSHSLLSSINDILDISNLEAGKMVTDPACCDLRRIVEELYDVFYDQAQAKGLDMNLILSPELPELVITDQGRLTQCLSKLLDNALKFTLQGQVQLVVSVTHNGKIRFDVKDSGIGIPRQNQKEIFEAFTQINDEDSSQRIGRTGLGLAIASRLAQLMGGEISLESHRGCGSTFSVMLPLPKCSNPVAAQNG